jgi:hypothetical protein
MTDAPVAFCDKKPDTDKDNEIAYLKEIVRLKTDNDNLNSNNRELSRSLNSARIIKNFLLTELAETKAQHQTELSETKAQHQTELANIRAQYVFSTLIVFHICLHCYMTI